MNKRHFLPLGIVGGGLLFALWLSFAAITPVVRAAEEQPQKPAYTPSVLAQVILTPTKDNTLYETPTGSTSSGAGAGMFVGKTNAGSIRRGLLAFNLSGRIPATATIISVTLRLNMLRTAAGTHSVALHKVTADWGEGTSDAGGSGGGNGEAATTNDATWLHTFFDTKQWQTAGGDFVAAASASASVGGSGPYTWSSPSMIADIQSWVSNPTSNFGWIVVGNEALSRTAKTFDTKETVTAANRPQLTIVYQLPGENNQKVYMALIQK